MATYLILLLSGLLVGAFVGMMVSSRISKLDFKESLIMEQENHQREISRLQGNYEQRIFDIREEYDTKRHQKLVEDLHHSENQITNEPFLNDILY